MSNIDTTKHLSARGREAERRVAAWLEEKGWHVERDGEPGQADLVASQGDQVYVVEVKALSEGRPDRVIPLLSQAILQAQTYKLQAPNTKPLAVVYVEHAPSSLLKQVIAFAEQYVDHVDVGVVSADGISFLRQAASGVVELSDPDKVTQNRLRPQNTNAYEVVNLFSDLNQWMLKLLLAPDIPENLLNAPRTFYYSGAELAAAAQVSSMSVSRFLKQLRSERFLDESANHLALVRREELFARWRASALRTCPEIPVRVAIRSIAQQQVSRFLEAQNEQACWGLFAAAEKLGMGHVSGVPPYICVPKLPHLESMVSELGPMAAYPDGQPDFVVRQASSPRSTFRGAVHQDGVLVADVIQIWLDVSGHPSRGKEQADHIYRKVLHKVIEVGR